VDGAVHLSFLQQHVGRWQKLAKGSDSSGTKALKDFFLIFFFTEGLCVGWMVQLPLLYHLRMRSFVYAYLYIFLI
jgi:hypothetical protein